MTTVLCIEGSPRRGGNTAQLARLVIRHIKADGRQVARFSVGEQHFESCLACNTCLRTGQCCLYCAGDQMPKLYEALDACDALLWITPLYFAGVPAQLKCLIDRFQPYYGRRLLYGRPAASYRRQAAAIILGAGGDPFGADAAALTLRSASQMAEFRLLQPLVISGADAPGDILSARFATQRMQALNLADMLTGKRLRDV